MNKQHPLRRAAPLILLPALAALLLASCAEMFQEKIPFPSKDTSGSLDEMFRTIEEESLQLDTPAQLYAAPFYSRSEVRLSWEEVPGAAYYMIERAAATPPDSGLEWQDPEDGEYAILERFVYGGQYTDEILRNPSLNSPEYQYRYYYRVSAFNPAKNFEQSEPCEAVYAMLFRSPANARASGGTSSAHVRVSWDRTESAVSYEIWRSASERGVPALLGSIPSNQNYYINNIDKDDQGKEFFYIITAKNSFGNVSLQTRPAMGFARVEGSPDAPDVRRSAGHGRGNSVRETRIEWDPVDDAEHYAVYRYSSADSSLTRLTAQTANTYWVDSAGLRPGIYYYYRVQAIGRDASDRELKSPLSGTGDRDNETDQKTESFLLSPPDTVIVEKSSGSTVNIKWRPPIGSPDEHKDYIYTVYADPSLNGDFSNAARAGIASDLDSEGYIGVTGISTDGGHFFRVVTFKGLTESAPSIVVAPVPSAAIIQNASQHSFISPETRANSNGVYPVKVDWKKPDGEDPFFYHVFRSTRPDGGFARINEAPLNADGTGGGPGYSLDEGSGTFSFVDRNDTARAGKKYYYRVLSLNQLGGGNLYSETRTGWGALTHTQFIIEYNKTMSAALKKLTYMHKSGSTDKLGTETKNGSLGGTIYYNAAISGLGARIIIQLTNYADFYIENEPENGAYFTLSGNSNTSANMSSNGTMDGTVNCTGMYPGWVKYDGIEIKGGAAGGGTYEVQPAGFPAARVSYTVLN
jgi:hypothetical protein